jgi:hypothetical protein
VHRYPYKTRKGTKLTPIGRLVSLVAILMIGATAGAAGAAATRPHAQAWRCITVRPGETLWSIAGHNPAPDRRETIFRIEQENGLADGAPQAGSAIWVPNEGSVGSLDLAPAANCPKVGG